MKKKKTDEIKFNISKSELKRIFNEYKFDEVDKELEYDDFMLKYINAYEKLNDVDKIIMALYAEFQSQRKVADLLKVSRTTVVKSLNNIREQINNNLC